MSAVREWGEIVLTVVFGAVTAVLLWNQNQLIAGQAALMENQNQLLAAQTDISDRQQSLQLLEFKTRLREAYLNWLHEAWTLGYRVDDFDNEASRPKISTRNRDHARLYFSSVCLPEFQTLALFGDEKMKHEWPFYLQLQTRALRHALLAEEFCYFAEQEGGAPGKAEFIDEIKANFKVLYHTELDCASKLAQRATYTTAK